MQSIVTVGIDVSKEKLDIAIFDGKKFFLKTFSNSENGVEKLIDYVEERTGINKKGVTKRKKGIIRKERNIRGEKTTEKEIETHRNRKGLTAARQKIRGKRKGTADSDKNENGKNELHGSHNCIHNVKNESVHFVMEATGSYHMKALFGISKRNYPVYVLNPVISKRYTEERMKRVITDKESSKSLAQYAFVSLSANSILSGCSEDYNALNKFRFDSKFELNNTDTSGNCIRNSNGNNHNESCENNKNNENRENSENNNFNGNLIKSSVKLKILIKTAEGLVRTKTRIMNQIEALNQYPEGFSEEAIEVLEQLVKEIDKRIKSIRDTIKETINNDNESRKIYERITKIPGIGERAASSIIAYFGSFSSFESAKQVASYIGLTPSIKESGKSVKKNGYAISKTGNPYLRQVLFMASLSASQYNPQCSLLYNRLLNREKNKKLIHIAVAHKLIRQVFAVVKYGKEYDPLYGISNEEKEYGIVPDKRFRLTKEYNESSIEDARKANVRKEIKETIKTKKIDENSLKTKITRKITNKQSKLKTNPDKIYSKPGNLNMKISY